MSLRPAETSQKMIISTTSRMVGEFEGEGVLVAHAWPGPETMNIRFTEGPLSRSSYMVVFETPPIERLAGTVVPDYSYVGEVICALLSVLFGKRFDNHGPVESSGHYRVPEVASFSQVCNHLLPQNSHKPRADFPIPLNLEEVSRVSRLITDEKLDENFKTSFHSASKFYCQALKNAEQDPEVAYLHLITAGEILSGFLKYELSALLDDETKANLELIREKCPEGDRIAQFISNRLFQVKKRFLKSITDLCDPGFFQRSEVPQPFGRFKADTFWGSIAAAYDLRSRYVHTGVPFGSWVAPRSRLEEVQIGQPVVG